jgi:hypothetical protein
MPKNKDLKRVIRARMQKTGESYTTARLHTIVPKVPTGLHYLVMTSSGAPGTTIGQFVGKQSFPFPPADVRRSGSIGMSLVNRDSV